MPGTKKILNKICFVSIDIESDFAKNKSFRGVENLDKIFEIFKKYNIPATLFVTGTVFGEYTEKVKKWARDYEIACHSFTHRFWDEILEKERRGELEKFIELYKKIFGENPKGFRAPSHIIDEKGLGLLVEKGFLYDSSIIPHYPFFKKYRGYRGKAPLSPYWLNQELLEIPVVGQIFGVPLAGSWIQKLPFFVYKILFLISTPVFLTFNLHSWDSLNSELLRKIERLFKILRNRGYQFLKGHYIYELFSKN